MKAEMTDKDSGLFCQYDSVFLRVYSHSIIFKVTFLL